MRGPQDRRKDGEVIVTLYELTGNLLELVQEADHHETTDDETIEAWQERVDKELATVSEHLEDKLESCSRMVRQLGADEDALKAEMDRFRVRKLAVHNHKERLKNYMTHAILTLVDPDAKGRRRVKTTNFLTWVQKNPMSVDSDGCDVVALDDQFVEFVPKVKSREILNEVKATGVIPDGAVLKEVIWSIRIK